MLLNLNDDNFSENPDEEAISSAIQNLSVDQFAVLSRAENEYIQTYHNDDGSFQLEYRDGAYDKHYEATSDRISLNDAQRAFAAYFSGGEDWHLAWDWEILEFDQDFGEDLTFDSAYLLNGAEYRKIPVGSERNPADAYLEKCPVCAAMTGDFHVAGCELEECPRCHELIHECDCE